jgi:hypothetical protein
MTKLILITVVIMTVWRITAQTTAKKIVEIVELIVGTLKRKQIR